ncbi:MAG: hypothetical protein KatS3mg110_4244 [Pirellulaceae bacterium]|nr:MAG: hypothetical protein KatS3mg110_4244 [Pirellulaceae bacterium]
MNSPHKRESDGVLSIRPKVAELVFSMYGRALHPELFHVFQRGVVERGTYQAKLEITAAGHVITWRYHGLTLTEVAAASNQPLPRQRQLLYCRLRGERTERIVCRGGVIYQTSFQLESLPEDVFWTFQQELMRDGQYRGLFHQFESSGRMALGAVSFMHVETRLRSMLVQSFHTFPDDYAVVKVQSLFELP